MKGKTERTFEIREGGKLKGLFPTEAKARAFKKELGGRTTMRIVHGTPAKTKKRTVRSNNAKPRKLLDGDGDLDPYMVETMEDLRDYAVYEDPSLKKALYEKAVWDYIRDYFEFCAWNEHGNGISLGEAAEERDLAMHVADLTEGSNGDITDYLDNGELAEGDRALDLLRRRARIQKAHGVVPDFKED